jgi:hypothetical protein
MDGHLLKFRNVQCEDGLGRSNTIPRLGCGLRRRVIHVVLGNRDNVGLSCLHSYTILGDHHNKFLQHEEL